MLQSHSQAYTQEIGISSDTSHLRVVVGWDRLRNVNGWKILSLVRYKPFWIQPQLHTSLTSHPHLASHLLLLKSPDWSTALVVYPVSTLNVNHVLVVEDGVIKSNVNRVVPTNNDEKAWVVCLEANGAVEERRCVRRVVEIVRGLVGPDTLSARTEKEEGEAEDKEEDDLWDGLGICTWESLFDDEGNRIRPTKDLLLSLIPDESIPMKTLLIDDGWQHTHSTPTHRRLISFEPYEDFGGSLEEVVSAIKGRGIERVGVWLTLQGYWEGIHPSSELIGRYGCREYIKGKPEGGLEDEAGSNGDTVWLPPPESAKRFWNDWFGGLRGAGIDFIKCDNQADSTMAVDPDGFHAQQSLWSGMLEAAQEHFGIRGVIMCMANNERMLNGPGGLEVDRPKGDLVFRNSDDFNLNYSNTHPDQIHFNTYNTILTSHLSLTPDFDMFASSPSSLLPTYHALLRAMGPGPVLLSDTPYNPSDKGLISRLIGKTKNGKTKVLKGAYPAQVLSNRWFWDNLKGNTDGSALVAGSKFDESVGGLIGAWNVHDYSSDAIARDKITWRDIEDLMDLEEDEDTEFCLTVPMALSRGKRSSTHEPKIALVNSSDSGYMDLTLDRGECGLVAVSRLYAFGEYRVGVVGLKDKFGCMSGIGDVEVDQENRTVHFSSKYISESISLIVIKQGKRAVSAHEDKGVTMELYIDEKRCIGSSMLQVHLGLPDDDATAQLVNFDIPEEVLPGRGRNDEDQGVWKMRAVVDVR
ncbi:hypothetical protein I302_103831 [Kwoniella bestiolae CBS 10118]|uniref:Alpha-galactosidase n=1 Tax=Kwoniella bestiolae CBS 10118 TaxID=1296100 RepID=A0A1B9G9N5_9TREE|nr:hypothetical protein I302_02534 [Kwoniella bestiolae CBS 10118]OCF27690.1 hypothetical protein I302_02534 [Kwoniella bestiolae CBS 10118]